MSGEYTKEKILDSAEELFSDNGFAATSIRAITTRAGVNLAALNYHFGSKDALIDAVFERRIGGLNLERIRLLDEVESMGKPSLEEVLRAFLAPPIRLAGDPARGGKVFMRLMGRAHTEPGDFFRNVIAKQFEEIFRRFGEAFRRVLPNLSPGEIFWRMHFIVGAMAFTMSHKLTLRYLEGFEDASEAGIDDFVHPDAGFVLERLVGFSAAGLRADVPELTEGGRN